MTTQEDALKTQKTCSTDTDRAVSGTDDTGSCGRIVQFSVIRVLACCAVVVLHTVFAANEYFIETVTPAENLFSRIVENNVMWAVPLFLMVTGALLLRQDRELTLQKLYGKYITRVFAALVVFSLFFRLFDMVMDREVFSMGSLLGGAAVELITGHGWGHLWYLYLLIGLYVLMPFYRLVAHKCSEKELEYLLIVYVVFASVIPMIEGFGININFYISETLIYPLYLFLGSMLHERRFKIPGTRAAWMVSAATFIIIVLDVIRNSYGIDIPDVFFGYSSLLVVVQAAGIFALSERIKLSDNDSRLVKSILILDRNTFGIYLISMLFVRLMFKYIRFNPYDTETVPSLIALAACIVIVLIASCAATGLLRQIPGFRRIL